MAVLPKKRVPGRTQALLTSQEVVESQVPSNRREEIRAYLKLFGYNPESSILQVHLAGSFGGGKRRAGTRQAESRERAAKRYGGHSFVVLGRSHDPSLLQRLIPPTRMQDESGGYRGYLWKHKDEEEKAPDELLPLDFVPASLSYLRSWRDLFLTSGYLITMHVPSNFAKYKNELTNRLRRIRGDVDVKSEWHFLDELKEFGYEERQKNSLKEKENSHNPD